jgi:hypothetical protein
VGWRSARTFAFLRSHTMGKITKGNKETKKPAAKSTKEKRAAKQAKKHASDVVPLIVR